MTPTGCIDFKLTSHENKLGTEEAIKFYQQQIADGSTEIEHFERLALLLEHTQRIDEEVQVLQNAVGIFEQMVFVDKLKSALPTLNMFTAMLREARQLNASSGF